MKSAAWSRSQRRAMWGIGLLVSAWMVLPAGVEGGEDQPAAAEDHHHQLVTVLAQDVDRDPPPDQARYTVMLVPVEAGVDLLSFPCGAPFELPGGRHRMWVEGPASVSTMMLVNGGGPGQAEGASRQIAVAVRPAGEVVLADDIRNSVPASYELRVLHMTGHISGDVMQSEFGRVVVARDSGPMTMPVGPLYTALYDRDSHSYIAFSRPQVVTEGERVVARPVAPSQGRSDLMVRLERPGLVPTVSGSDVAVSLGSAARCEWTTRGCRPRCRS